MTTSWDAVGERAETDADGAFALGRVPRSAARLYVSGDDFRSVSHVLEPGGDLDSVAIRVERLPDAGRYGHVRIELADPARADGFALLDPAGEAAVIATVRGGYRSTSYRGEIAEGRSIAYTVRPGDYEFVLYAGEAEVERRRVVLPAGEVTTVRL